jgi:hypothetical protein
MIIFPSDFINYRNVVLIHKRWWIMSKRKTATHMNYKGLKMLRKIFGATRDKVCGQ